MADEDDADAVVYVPRRFKPKRRGSKPTVDVLPIPPAVMKVPGPKGEPGERGPEGPAGRDAAPGSYPSSPQPLVTAPAPIPGPAGRPGERGPKGDPGPAGPQGPAGKDGADGYNGWTPLLAIVSDGDRSVLRIVGWFGGSGPEPEAGMYMGPSGPVETIYAASNIRGPAGPRGAQGHGGGGIVTDPGTGGGDDGETAAALNAFKLLFRGGSESQALVKLSSADYDWVWADVAGITFNTYQTEDDDALSTEDGADMVLEL